MTGTWSREGSKIATLSQTFRLMDPLQKSGKRSIKYQRIYWVQLMSQHLIYKWQKGLEICCLEIQTRCDGLWGWAGLQMSIHTSASHHHLRTAAHGDLQVPATRTVTYGPRVPPSSETVFQTHFNTLHWQFYSRLKTHLFGLSYGSTSWLFRLLECAI